METQNIFLCQIKKGSAILIVFGKYMQISSAIPTEHIITVSRHLLITLLNLLGSHDPVVAVEYLSVRYKTCASLKLQYIYLVSN